MQAKGTLSRNGMIHLYLHSLYLIGADNANAAIKAVTVGQVIDRMNKTFDPYGFAVRPVRDAVHGRAYYSFVNTVRLRR